MSHELSINEQGQAEMFSLRETPWHGLGTVLQNPPTAEEAIEAAGLNWTVRKSPLYAKNSFGEIIEVNDFRAIQRDDNDVTLGVARKRWTPLQNASAFRVFNPLVQNGFANFETAGALHRGEIVWVMVKLNITDPRVTDVLGTDVVPYVMVDNSHSGSRALRLTETPLRVVCKNTLLGARGAAKRSVRIPHSSKVESTLVNEAKNLWSDLVETYAEIAADFLKLKNTVLDEELFESLVLDVAAPLPNPDNYSTVANAEKAMARVEGVREKITELWTGGRGHVGDHSAWEAYNGFAEWFDHFRDTRSNYAIAAVENTTPHAAIVAGLMDTENRR